MALHLLWRVQGTILPGVTRRSIIELAQQRGYTVEEVPVTVDEAMEADELFTTGTAVVVCAVGSLTYRGNRKQYGTPGQPGGFEWHKQPATKASWHAQPSAAAGKARACSESTAGWCSMFQAGSTSHVTSAL